VEKVKLLFLKWSWFDWKSRHHVYQETKAILVGNETVGLRIKVLLAFQNPADKKITLSQKYQSH